MPSPPTFPRRKPQDPKTHKKVNGKVVVRDGTISNVFELHGIDTNVNFQSTPISDDSTIPPPLQVYRFVYFPHSGGQFNKAGKGMYYGHPEIPVIMHISSRIQQSYFLQTPGT